MRGAAAVARANELLSQSYKDRTEVGFMFITMFGTMPKISPFRPQINASRTQTIFGDILKTYF